MKSQELVEKYVMNTYARKPLCIVSGENATCYDENGKQYIDFSSGIGVNSLGFCNDDWSAAIAKQSQTLQHTSNLYVTQPMAILAEKLCLKTGYAKVFYANSGAEANEGAIKLARKYSFDKYGAAKKRYKIISLVNSFHGRTITTLAATGQDVFHQSFHPFTEGFDYAQANNIDDLLAKLDDTVCAVMIEWIQGEGGVNPLDPEYAKALSAVCQENDLLLIADEVQTGVGRTGQFLASQHYGIQPDITTLAKGLGGGLPIGAFLCNERLANCLQYGDHGTTFGGNPVVCAGANVVLEKVDDGLLEAVRAKEALIRETFAHTPEVMKIDGMGLMLGIQLQQKQAATVVDECLAEGLIVLTAKDKIRLLPPLTISETELKTGLEILLNVLNQPNKE